MNNAPSSVFAVVAKHQTLGRGTHGREWKSSSGNLYMTLSFHRSLVTHFPLHLTPLKYNSVVFLSYSISFLIIPVYRIGSILVPCVRKYVLSNGNDNTVALKWPNDILINNAKVCL